MDSVNELREVNTMTERPDVNELDEVELGMIKRGDMLGSRLGAKTYSLLLSQAQEIERLRAELKAIYDPPTDGSDLVPMGDEFVPFEDTPQGRAIKEAYDAGRDFEAQRAWEREQSR